jgi:23S rRNA (uracil1939-C5)-methyltransferase
VPAPPAAFESKLVQIEKPIFGGAFLARVEGKAVFVPLTLPGEQVRVRITQSKRGYDTADPDEIVSASPDRIAPACPHFGPCGGCSYQHTNYQTQLAFKQLVLRETLERGGVIAPAEINVLSAQPWHYRNRIRLAFDEAGNPGYRGRRSNAVVPISECPIAAPLLVSAANAFARVARSFAPAFRLSELSLFCDAAETSLLASVFVPGAPNLPLNEFAEAIHERVPALTGVELIIDGRASQPPRTIGQWGATSLVYPASGVDYRVDHGAFFQVNRFLIDALVNEVAGNYKGSFAWDLFAGVGLFARRLTRGFDSVVAVESAPSAVQALAANLKGTTGTSIPSTTLDFLRKNRKPPRSATPRPDLVVVDPPRTGLGPELISLFTEVSAPAVVYVSCDPATLARDLNALAASGYAIQSITLADLFPQTFHLETVVHLRRA